jgi:hypothetical protein
MVVHETAAAKAIPDELSLLAVWVGSIFISPDTLHDITPSRHERLFYYTALKQPLQDCDDRYIVYIMTITMISVEIKIAIHPLLSLLFRSRGFLAVFR